VLELEGSDGQFVRTSRDEVRVGMSASIEPASGLAAWWPGNGDGREVVERNSPLQSFNGQHFGDGKISQAFVFDGVDDHGRVEASPEHDIGSSPAGFTIELWAKPGRFQDVPLLQWTSSSIEGVSFRQWNGGNGLFGFLTDTTGQTRYISVASMFTPGVWIHVALTYDRLAGIARLYRNGVVVAEQNVGVFTPRTNLPIEVGSLTRERRYFQGSIDEISLYERPLSAAEIFSIYASGSEGKNPPDDNLPPTVDAGDDILLPSHSLAVNLAGLVDDDQRPFGPPVIAWTKVAGPGNVTFENIAAPTTTATFSVPGTYLLKLSASDQYGPPVSDLVEVRLGAQALPNVDGLATWWPGNGDGREVVHGNAPIELFNGADYNVGPVLHGFWFDGLNDIGRVNIHPDIDLGASAAGLTVELWAKADHTQDTPLLQWESSNAEGLSIRQWGGNGLYAFIVHSSGTLYLGVPNVFQAGVWKHVAFTYDRASGLARIYRDGVVLAEQNVGSLRLRTDLPLAVGASPREGRFFRGTLDEVACYTRALSPAEIGRIFRAGSDGKAPLIDNVQPLVNAGPDRVVASTASAAQLLGSVSDDGKPFGSPLIDWSLVAGPGPPSLSPIHQVRTLR
jgi:hypothetical protein